MLILAAHSHPSCVTYACDLSIHFRILEIFARKSPDSPLYTRALAQFIYLRFLYYSLISDDPHYIIVPSLVDPSKTHSIS